MEIYNSKLNKAEILERVGDMSQIADAREGILQEGRADGMRVIDVKTGSGLEFSILPSRAMDIAWASYKGMPLAHVSKSGIVKPEFYEKDGRSFLRSFSCGLLTSCGLTQMGTPCEHEGESLGLHGRLSNIPASQVAVKKFWDSDDYRIRVEGAVRESRIFGENMLLERRIETKLGSRAIHIYDTVTNEGFKRSPFMLLYHINLGYPLLSGNSTLKISKASEITPRDAEAEKGMADITKLSDPIPGYSEQVFFHSFEETEGRCRVDLWREDIGCGVYIIFDTKEFPHMCQWKMFGQGEYVLGIEPCTCPPIGRARAEERGILEILEPFEQKRFHVEIGITEK